MSARNVLDTEKRVLVYFTGEFATDRAKMFLDDVESLQGIHLHGVNGFQATAVDAYGITRSCTIRREPIKNRSGLYWYAYKRSDGKLKKKYVGTDDKLTFEVIRAMIATLCNTRVI